MPESLQAKLAAARRRWRSLLAAGGLAASAALLIMLCLVSFHTDRLLALTTPGRYAWLLLLIAALAGSGLALVLWPLRRPLADEVVAAQVERAYPTLNERLLTTVELARAGSGAGISSAMVSQLALETERLAAPLDFIRAIPMDRLRRPVAVLGMTGVLLTVHVVLAPGAMANWAQRILNPAADIPLYANTQVWVEPGDIVVPRGEPLNIGIRAAGVLPDRATLHYRFDGGQWMDADITKGRDAAPDATPDVQRPTPNTRLFGFRLPDVQQDLTYYATAGDGRANPHTIHVEDRPTILNVRLHLDYPAYMNRRDETVTATAGNIVAPVGTKVAIEATANKPLRHVELVENGKERGAWMVSGTQARGDLIVQKDENYSLRLRDTRDFDALNPPQYTIRAQADQSPQVQIAKPGADLERAPNGLLDLRVNANDDYGVQDLRLAYHIAKRSSGGLSLPITAGAKQVVSGGPWSLGALNLKAGDTVTYEAVAHDNDAISGPHAGRSATYTVRIIGAREMRERLEAEKAQEREALKLLIQHQREAQAELSKAQKTGKAEQTQQAQMLQRNAAQEAAELAHRMQQTTDQLRDNNMSAPNEEKQRQASQQTLQSLSQKAMPQAADTIQRNQLNDAARQEEAIRQQLEGLSEKAAPPPDAFQLAERAEQLSQAQQKLADKSALREAQMNGKTPDKMTAQERADMKALAQEQAALKAQTQALQKQIEQAAQSAQAQKQASAADMQKAAQQARESGVQQKQSSAQQNLQAGQPDQAAPKQNDAARDLQNLAKSLDQAGQKQRDADAATKRAQELDKLADKLVDLANQQSRVASKIQPGMSQETSQQQVQKEQQIHPEVGAAAEQLKDQPQAQRKVQQAGDNIKQAMEQLNARKDRDANTLAKDAARQLLQAAQDIRQTAQAMEQAQETRRLQGQVEQLAREQRGLYQQTQQVDKQLGAQPNMTPEQRQKLQNQAEALAKNQARLQERTQELKQDTNSNAFEWALDQASSRMDNARQKLQRGQVGADTQRPQENAAQTLERIARALGQQADGEQQQAEQQESGQQSGQESQMAKAQGELQLAREMQAQIRQETGSVDQRRAQNPDRRPTAEQEREIDSLSQAQRQTQQITKRAADQLKNAPQIGKTVQQASEEMEDVQQRLRQQHTENDTQAKQEKIVGMLDQAIRQTQQAMRQQRQQMAQQKQQQGNQPGQQGEQQAQGEPQQGGNQPLQKTFAPISKQQAARTHAANQEGRGFGNLSPRAQQSLREGRQERVPAEYRDLVNQYYKALSERGK